MPEETPKEDFKYWAFICYSHTDEKWGQWLHRALETYRVPKHLVGKKTRVGVVPRRVFPVFRDRDELPGSANLGEHIEAALKASRFLIVICSPRAVNSKWVDQEIRIFKSLGREERVLCLVVEGEPHATTRHECHEPECLPDAVRFWVHSDRSITPIPTEPIAADARKGKDGKKYALLKVLAGMLGLEYDALRQREEERRQKQQQFFLTVGVTSLIILSLLGAEFYMQKNEAIDASRTARAQYMKAREAGEKTLKMLKEKEEATREAQDAADKAKKSEAEARQAERDAFEQRRKAEAAVTATQKANEELAKRVESETQAKEKAKESENAMRRTLALSDLASAARLSEEGNEAKSLAYLSRALRYDPENVAVISRIISILSQNNWALPTVSPLLHDAAVKSAAFSPNGKQILTCAGNSVVLWDAATGQRIYSVQHFGAINSVEFSPDGKSFVTASHDNTAQIWETESGNKIGGAFRHEGYVLHATFSPDGKWLATATQDKKAVVWEIDTGKSIVLEHDARVEQVRFTTDGKSVVTACLSMAQRWELATGSRIGVGMAHSGTVQTLAISPDGNYIATGANDGARVWNAVTGEPITALLPHDSWVDSVKFSADSRQLLTASADTTARLWDISSEKNISFKHERGVKAASFSPNGRWIATASADGLAHIWKTTGELFCEGPKHLIAINDVQFSPDGKFLVTASEDKSAKVWSVSSSRPAVPTLLHEKQVNTACFSPDGRLLATVSDDKTARIWDVKTGQPASAPLRHFGERDKAYVISVAFSPNGQLLATGDAEGAARLWDVTTGKALFQPLKHESWVNSVCFSPDGQWLLTGSERSEIGLWNVANGSPVYKPLIHDGHVKEAVFSDDGKWIVSTAEAKNVKLWEAATGKLASTNFIHPENVLSVALSPDGEFLATGCEDKHARIWNRATGELILDLPHDSKVSIVAFTPAVVWKEPREQLRKQWLLTVSEKIARVWDVKKQKALTEPIKSDEEIRDAAFGPHGNLLVIAAGQNVRVWEASTGRAVAEPMEYEKEVRSVTFSPDGNFIAVTSADQSARIWLVSLHGTAPTWFADMVDAAASYKLDNFGAAELFSDQWNNFRSVQDTLATAPASDAYAVWARWFLNDRTHRTISAFSSTTVAEYVRRRAEEGSPAALDEALDLQPNHALALVKLARRTKESAQAEFLSRLAESYEPQNTDVLWVRAQVLQNLMKFNDAIGVMERALSLDPKNIKTFGPDGTDISSTDWLPKGWSDHSPLTAQASYVKTTDVPQPGFTGIKIIAAGNLGAAELHGPRVVCRRYKKIIVEGWARSLTRDDFTVGLAQFIEPFEKYKEQIVRTTADWKPFKVTLSPVQDIAAELRLLCSRGNKIEVAGVVCRVE